MKIVVMSDIHDNFHNLALAMKKIKEAKAERIIFLGDFINGGIAKILASSEIPVFAVWGNNDGDKVMITKTSLQEGSNLQMSDTIFDSVEHDGRKIFLTHYPALAKPMAKSGDFDAVFYAHNHEKNIEKIGDCLILNPGEISAHKSGEATFAIYDTKTNDAEIISLENTVTVKTEEADEQEKEIKFAFGNKTHKA